MPPKKKIKASSEAVAQLLPSTLAPGYAVGTTTTTTTTTTTATTTTTSSIVTDGGGGSLFDMNDNCFPLKLILSFILAPQKEDDLEWDGKYSHRLSKVLAESCTILPCVNKRFNHTVIDIMNGQVIKNDENGIKSIFQQQQQQQHQKCVGGTGTGTGTGDSTMLSPEKLAKIKSTSMQLDLSTIENKFIHDAEETWSVEGIDIISDRFGGTQKEFAKIISKEYRHFLVIKCIEILVRTHNHHDDDDDADPLKLVNVWMEKCTPTKIVDKFWHAHMLSPKLYNEHCIKLIGKIIDHDSMYESPKTFVGSDYKSKKDFIFKFEEKCGFFLSNREDVFGGRMGNDGEGEIDTLLFSPDVNVNHLIAMIYDDMNGDNDCG
jgi:hypothetical protein